MKRSFKLKKSTARYIQRRNRLKVTPRAIIVTGDAVRESRS